MTGNYTCAFEVAEKLTSCRFPNIRPETTNDILERCMKMCPELVQGDPGRKGDHAPTIKELKALVIGEGCGFRPFRKGGVRLESEVIKRPAKDVPMVFNYG
jgi:D-amino-acid oxidase